MLTMRVNGKWRLLAVITFCIIGLMMQPTVAAAEEYQPAKIPHLGADYVSGNLEEDIRHADNVISWQLDHGGWNKNNAELFMSRPWNGMEDRSSWKNGSEQLGTIDNNATNDEILFLAMMYRVTGEVKYKEAAVKGLDFLLRMQVESGGWPQVYPASGSYSDYVTFNDGAMIRTMNVLRMYAEAEYPFDSDIADAERMSTAEAALDRGLDFILKAQIVVDGYPTVWSAQHDPITYEPRGARDYEHPSLSGSESVGIVNYLLSLPEPSDEVKKSIVGAIRWFDKVKLQGFTYVSGDPDGAYFYYDPEGTTWYRFYEIETFQPIFSGRNGQIKHNIHQIEQERRDGYRWAGDWAKDLITLQDELPYFKDISYQLDVERFDAIKQEQAAAADASDDLTNETEQTTEPAAGATGANEAVLTASEPSTGAQDHTDTWWLQTLLMLLVAIVMFGAGMLYGKKRQQQ